MTEFEILQLIGAQQQNITDQFQFWMASTFAVVIASYTAGHRLALWARIIIAILYAAAATVFYMRYLVAVELLVALTEQLRETGGLSTPLSTQSGPWRTSTLRQFVMIGGTLLAIVLVCVPTIANHSDDHDGRA